MFVPLTGGWLLAGVLITLVGGGLIIGVAHVALQSVARRLLQTIAELVLAFGMALVMAYLWWHAEWASIAVKVLSANSSGAAQQSFTAVVWLGVAQWFFATLGMLFVFLAAGDFYHPADAGSNTTPRHGGIELAAGILLLFIAAIAGCFTLLVSIALSVSAAH